MSPQLHVIKRVLGTGRMTPQVARYFQTLTFTARDVRRYERLAAKAQAGKLTSAEKAELFDLIELNDWLGLLKLRAEMFLSRQARAA